MRYCVCIFMLLLFLGGCNYLDVIPENDIETIETIFEKREDVDDWMKTCHALLTVPIASVSQDPAYMGCDEIVVGEFIRKSGYKCEGYLIGDGLQMSQEPYGNIWKKNQYYAGIRYCNIFFDQIDGVYNMEDSEKKLWIAEMKALKAHFYFELMRRYGPIVLVPKNIRTNVDIDAMQQSRAPIDSCVKEIVRLLDEAMKDLPPLSQKDQSRWAYYSLEAAATLKAHTLFYAASPLFNGNENYANFKNREGVLLFDPVYSEMKWKKAAEAIDEAIKSCLDNGKKLISGNLKATDLLSTMSDVEQSVLAQNFVNSEAILMVRPQGNGFWYPYTLPYLKSSDPAYGNAVYGNVSPTMKMVEMYYTEHGLPIEADKEWEYRSRYQQNKETNPLYRNVIPLNTEVLGLHLRREPRFYAHIAADRCYWQLGPTGNDNLLVEAYRGERFGSQAPIINNSVAQNLSGYWMKKGSYSNVALRNYSTTVGSSREEAFVIFRLAELYLMKAEAWNEYLEKPDKEHVYDPLNTVRKRAGIPDVETSWENYSNTRDKAKTKMGMREIIRHEWNIEFAFEGRRFWNLRRWMTAADELNTPLYGWNILGDNADSFYNNYNGPVMVWSKRGFLAPRDYLFPLRSEEVLVAGCVQNPGW